MLYMLLLTVGTGWRN